MNTRFTGSPHVDHRPPGHWDAPTPRAKLPVLDQTCISGRGAKRVVVTALAFKQRCGRCGIHGCGEICSTVVVGRSGPTGAVDPQRPTPRPGNMAGCAPCFRRTSCRAPLWFYSPGHEGWRVVVVEGNGVVWVMRSIGLWNGRFSPTRSWNARQLIGCPLATCSPLAHGSINSGIEAWLSG